MKTPMLDDSALKVSFAYGFDTVPAIILAAPDGSEMRRFVGFDKTDWQDLLTEMAQLSHSRPPNIDWSKYPQQRPGCGSKSVEPEIAERMEAEARGEKLTARQIEIGEEDIFEFMFERGLTDGLPVIPPTPERVKRMLTGTGRDPREVIASLPPEHGSRDHRKNRCQRRDGGMQTRIHAGGPRGSGSHRDAGVQRPRHHVDDLGCDASHNRERPHPGTHRHEHEDDGARIRLPGQRNHRTRGETDVAQCRRRKARRHRALHAWLHRQVHHLLRRMGGAQPLGATTCGARLQKRRERSDGVWPRIEFTADRRSNLAHCACAVRKPWSRAGVVLASEATWLRRGFAGCMPRACRHHFARQMEQGASPCAYPGDHLASAAGAGSRCRVRRGRSAEGDGPDESDCRSARSRRFRNFADPNISI